MNRVIISAKQINGKYKAVVNPVLIYLDFSVWIEIFNAYLKQKEKLIEKIVETIGTDNYK
jgi:hypothetical protein